MASSNFGKEKEESKDSVKKKGINFLALLPTVLENQIIPGFLSPADLISYTNTSKKNSSLKSLFKDVLNKAKVEQQKIQDRAYSINSGYDTEDRKGDFSTLFIEIFASMKKEEKADNMTPDQFILKQILKHALTLDQTYCETHIFKESNLNELVTGSSFDIIGQDFLMELKISKDQAAHLAYLFSLYYNSGYLPLNPKVFNNPAKTDGENNSEISSSFTISFRFLRLMTSVLPVMLELKHKPPEVLPTPGTTASSSSSSSSSHLDYYPIQTYDESLQSSSFGFGFDDVTIRC